MKKQISAAILSAFIFANLTACSKSPAEKTPQNSSPESVPAVSDVVSSVEEKTPEVPKEDNTPVKTANAPVPVYGEVDIPEFPGIGFCEDGRLTYDAYFDEDYTESCLDKMVFETHTVGEYTLRLSGENVRVNHEFPDRIFISRPSVEVEKNGVMLERDANFGGMVEAIDLLHEFVLYKDKIGSYVDLYELDAPVIAVRYFYAEPTDIKGTVNFVPIYDGEVWDGSVGVCEAGTGLNMNEDTSARIPVMVNKEQSKCRVALCSGGEFTVIDGKTLSDETVGIKYTFDFQDEPQFEFFTAEKIG